MCAALLGLMLVCSTMILPGDRLAVFVGRVQHAVAVSAAVQPHVDVAVAGHFERGHAFDGSQVRPPTPRDRARRLLQLAGQMERDRNRQFAEGGLLGLFQTCWQTGRRTWPPDMPAHGRKSSFRWNETLFISMQYRLLASHTI